MLFTSNYNKLSLTKDDSFSIGSFWFWASVHMSTSDCKSLIVIATVSLSRANTADSCPLSAKTSAELQASPPLIVSVALSWERHITLGHISSAAQAQSRDIRRDFWDAALFFSYRPPRADTDAATPLHVASQKTRFQTASDTRTHWQAVITGVAYCVSTQTKWFKFQCVSEACSEVASVTASIHRQPSLIWKLQHLRA